MRAIYRGRQTGARQSLAAARHGYTRCAMRRRDPSELVHDPIGVYVQGKSFIGFRSPAAFTSMFGRIRGESPTSFRERHRRGSGSATPE